MGNTYIESETAPIGDFINKVEALKVPVFQRSFAWTEDEIKLLWDDITAIIELPQPEYFLGSMVFKKKDGYYEIIDGQQRITAIYIILSCIRNIYRINSDTQRNEWFNREYFGKIDINTLTINSKFQMNEINNPFFQKYIVSESNIEEIEENIKNLPKKDTNHLLGKAIKQIYSLLIERQKEFSGTEFSSDALLSIHNIIQKHIYVLILKVSDEADAYTIFETLNDRGLGLTTMELLKNHIFEKSGMYLPSVQNEWSILRDNLLHSDPSDRFIHHYWTSIHGRTSKPQLFRLMRKQVNTPIQAVEFARSLRTSARLYAAFGNPMMIIGMTMKNKLEIT